MKEKLKFAFYWAASCGGCEVAVLDINEKILDVAAMADILFWPIALDFKYSHLKSMPDKTIDVCFFNGAIRNSENEEIAKLLRAKSKIMVAFGSCAYLGGIPGLGNVADREKIFKTVYQETPSTDNPENIRPQTTTKVKEGELHLPSFYDTVKTLKQVVDVDYFFPGCPPPVNQILKVVQAIAEGKLPPKGSVVGASDKTVCDECERKKDDNKIIKGFKGIEKVALDPEKCLLEQGIICSGLATRGGCEARCINKANMPCRGCFGPPPGVLDQGAKLLSAISSLIDANNPKEIERIVSQIKDLLGTFYRFVLPSSLIKRCPNEKNSH